MVHGKNLSTEGLHARPSSWTSSGLQTTDFLSYLGFTRDVCPFHHTDCYSKAIPISFDLPGFSATADAAFRHLKLGASALEACGMFLDQPEGLGYFYNQSSTRRGSRGIRVSGDGHNAGKAEKLKESEDDHFRYVLTWLDGRN